MVTCSVIYKCMQVALHTYASTLLLHLGTCYKVKV